MMSTVCIYIPEMMPADKPHQRFVSKIRRGNSLPSAAEPFQADMGRRIKTTCTAVRDRRSGRSLTADSANALLYQILFYGLQTKR